MGMGVGRGCAVGAFIVLIVAAAVGGKILAVRSFGLHRIWTNSKLFHYVNNNAPGTTATVCVNINNNGTHIDFRTPYNNKTIYSYNPKFKLFDYFCMTVVTHEHGYSVFVNNEFVVHHRERFNEVRQIFVSGKGTVRIVFGFREPIWAMKDDNEWTVDFQPNSVEVPMTINSIKTLSVGDYLIFVASVVSNNSVISIKLTGNEKSPLIFKIKLNNDEPRYTMTSMIGHKVHKVETFSGIVISMYSNRIAVAFVCEHRGWRVYLNGYDFLFYYHHLDFADINTLKMYGNTENEGGWRLLKVMRGSAELDQS